MSVSLLLRNLLLKSNLSGSTVLREFCSSKGFDLCLTRLPLRPEGREWFSFAELLALLQFDCEGEMFPTAALQRSLEGD